MLFRGMVQEFYISGYISDGSTVTLVEKNIVMNKFQMSASRRCFLCLHGQIPLAQSPHSTGVDILRFFFFLPPLFFWLQHKHFQCFLNGINIFRVFDRQQGEN